MKLFSNAVVPYIYKFFHSMSTLGVENWKVHFCYVNASVIVVGHASLKAISMDNLKDEEKRHLFRLILYPSSYMDLWFQSLCCCRYICIKNRIVAFKSCLFSQQSTT